MENKTINILGTDYKVKFLATSEDIKLADNNGYCDTTTKECVIDKI